MNPHTSLNQRSLPALIVLSLLLISIFIAPVAGTAQVALALTTGWSSPTANATATGFAALNTPANAYADDTNYSVTNYSSSTPVGQQYYGFTPALSIPVTATLQGIEVRVDYWIGNTSGTNTLLVDLSTDGSTWTTVTDQDTTEPTSQATVILGTPTELWGRSWTAADLSNLRVRVRMQTTSTTTRAFNLDYVAVRLTYNRTPNTPTNVSITPNNNGYVTSANPTFTWTAFSDPDTGDTQSQFYIQIRQNPGSYFYRSTTPSSPNNFYASSWNLADGNYCWNVRVSDNSGASNNTSALSTETCFTIDATAPASTASSPAYANASPFTVSATASDATSGLASVSLYYRGPTGSWTLFNTISGAGPYSWNFTPSLGNGTYYFQSVAYDNAGNHETVPSGTSGTGDDSTIYDNVAPNSSATPPAGPINTGSISIPWTASDATSGIATNGVTLYYNFNGGSYSTDGSASGTGGTFTFAPASGDGTYCFYTRATDNAGNVEAAPVSPNGDGCTIYKNKGSIGDLIWNDANGNGIFDAGDAGLNWQVNLTGPQSASTTAVNGAYSFTGLAAGTYTVTVSVPGGWAQTNPIEHPLVVTVAAGQDYTTADFGFSQNYASVSGYVWYDANRNGIRDAGETGLNAVGVTLRRGLAVIDTATSNADGFYFFGGLTVAGDYQVAVNPNDPNLGSLVSTTANPLSVPGVTVGNNYSNSNLGFAQPAPVVKPLYLHTGDLINRVRPGSNNTTMQIANDASHTWTMSPVVAGALQFTATPISVTLYLAPTSGSDLLGNVYPPSTRVTLRYGATVIGTPQVRTNMTGGTQAYTFSFTPPAGLAAGSAFSVQVDVYGASGGILPTPGNVVVYYDAYPAYNSRIDLPVYSYLRIDSSNSGTYDAAYPGGAASDTFIAGDTVYFRAQATDPFGNYDITGATLSISGLVTNTTMTRVGTPNTAAAVYQYSRSGFTLGSYTYALTMTEGAEGEVARVYTGSFNVIVSDLTDSSKEARSWPAGQLITQTVPGATISYTLHISNTGAALASNVTITDALPANTTYVAGSVVNGTYNAGLNAITWSGSLAGHSERTITFRVTLDPVLDNNSAIDNAVVINDGVNQFSRSNRITIVSAPNLSQSIKKVDKTTAAPGDALLYTIVLTNSGNMNATTSAVLPLVDAIPDNTVFNGGLFASAGIVSFNPGFNQIEWYGTVPGGSSVTIRFSARANSPLDNGTLITNTATINEGAGFANPQTYQRTATTLIASAPNLVSQSAKIVDKTVAAPGDILAYTILLRNIGNMNAPGVVLTDVLPANVTYSGDTYLSATSGNAVFYPITNTLVWQGDMNAGLTVQILFRVNTNTPLPNNTQIINTARVSDAVGNFTPFNLSAITTIQSSPNLNTSTKTVSAATASPGSTLTYTITLNNTGNAVANTSLVDTLPSYLQNPVIVSASSGTTQIVGGTQLTWAGSVTPTQPVVIVFRATLLPVIDNGTQVVNTASVNDGVNPAFNISPAAVTTIQSSPNLNTSLKTVDKATAAPGDVLVYTIVLTNSGNMAANTLMRDDLPANVTFDGGLSASAGQPLPTYSSINNRVTWQGTVVPGQPVTLRYQVLVNSPLNNGTVIQNDAEVNDGVHLPFNTTPPAQTVITSAPDLTTSSKSVDLVTAAPGDLLHYTLHLANTGNMIAAGVTLTDIIPTNVTFASGPFVSGGGSGGWNPGQRRVFWNGSVTPGSDVTVEFYATVNTPLANGTVITNAATIGGSFATVTTNAVTTTVNSAHALAVTKSAPSIIGAGQAMTYTIEYNVTGNEPATSVVITDVVPANTTYVSCTGGCTINGSIVSWNWSNLVPGNTGILTFRVTVGSLLPNGTVINNTAYISDAGGYNGQSSTSTTVTSGHGFSLSKRDTGYDPVQAGGTVVYSIDWSAAGTEAATSVVITDALPSNVTYVSCSPVTCSQAGGIVTWNLGNPIPGASGTALVTVTVASPLPDGTILIDQARISDSNGGVATTASEQTTVNSSHALHVTKSAPVSVNAGTQLAYTIAYSVTGNETALNVLIDDTTPPNTTFASASGAATIDNPGAGNSGLVRWHLGNLTPGTSGVVTLIVNVISPLPNGTVINNQVSMTDSNGGTTSSGSASTTVTSSHSFTLSKTDTPDPVTPNGVINYTLHWTVTGNETAQGVVITDALPANTSYSTCGACVLVGGYVQWDLGTRPPGSSGDLFLQVRVDTPLPNNTVITNTARVSDGNNGTAVSTSTTTTVNSDHQLSIDKSAPSVVQAGQNITYTLAWAVTGNEPATNVVITDVVPANTTYVSCTGGCTNNAGVLTWNLNNLVPGNSGNVSFIVTAGSLLPNGTVIPNTASIFDANGRRAQSSVNTTVSSGHGFSLSKSDTGYDPVQAGGTVVYSIDWSVAGTEVAQSVVITDALPANTAYASCGGATCSQVGGVVTWNLNNQNPGASGTVTVAVTVASPLPNGTLLTDNARIHDSNGGLTTTATEQTTVQSSHALHVTKTAPATVAAGGQITYTIAWSVTGNESAVNILVDDSTPANTTFARASGAATIDTPGVGNSGLVRWHLGNQAPGASGVVTLVVNVSSPLPNGTVINNQVSISDSNNGTTDSSQATTTVISGHSFTLSKTDTPDPVTPDGLINYNIHWTVTGNETAQNLVITDAIPLNTSYQTCGACVLLGSYVSWSLGNQAPGASGDVFLQVHVGTPIVNGTIIVNNARIFDGNSGVAVNATASTTVNSDHQLTLNKTAPATIQAGQVLNYSIAWSVTGNEPASTVIITDAVPVNTAYASCGGATCSVAGGVVTWNLGNLVPGNSGIATLAVTVTSPLPNGTVINNTARIFDASNRNATSSASTTVTSGHSFNLSKSDAPDPVQAGGTIVYTLNWSLTGNEAATAVVITDALPANTTFASCSNGCTQPGGIVTWNLGNQSIGASGSVTVAVNVASPLPNGTVLTNNARIADSNGGIATTASAQTTVNSSHALAITKTDAPDPVQAGGQITYTLRYTVTGNETAQNVVINDVTPVNTTFASASGAGTINAPPVGSAGTVQWQLGNLTPGTSAVAILVVNVNSPLANGTVINNQATISDGNGGATVNSSASTTVNSSHVFTLTKSDTPDPVAPNGLIFYTIHYAVTGNETAQTVVVTDAIPANTTFSSCSSCAVLSGYVSWNLGNLTPGTSGDLSLQVRVNTPLANGTVINNAARISDSNNGTPVVATASTTVTSDHQFTLSKSAASVIQAGQLLTYTINWSVTGDEPASGVTITDAVPANTTYVSCTSGCSQAAGLVTWNLGNRVPGNSGTVQFTVQVVSPLPNGTVINNTAYIFDATRSATASASTTVGSGHGYSLSKSDAPDPVQAGGTILYTLNWSLSGNEAATGVVITDALPANTTFASCSNGCTQPGGIVTWNLGAQNIGASGVVTVAVNVATPLPNGTVLTNNARIADSNGGIATTASAQTTVNSSHLLNITKTGPTSVSAGGQITYTLRYTVTGNETAQNVTIDDNTPLNTTFASATGSGTIQTPPIGSTGLVRWQLGNLTPGTSGVATLIVNVNSPLANGTVIANTATIADTNGGTTVNSSWNTTVGTSHSFTLSKSDTPDPVAPNGIINYTINWAVSGNEVAQNVVITDAIPANTTLVSPGTCSQVGSIVQCTLGNQNPGALGAVVLQVRVNTPLANGTVINNAARISDSNNGTPVVASTTTTVQSDHQFTLSKSAASVIQAGQLLTYTINWSVTGDEPASGVTITDAVPANTTYVAASCTGGCSVAGGVVTWALGARVPGNSGTVQFTVQVVSPLPNGTVINNTARIFDATRSATASASTTVGSGHGYSLSKSDAPDPVQAGGTLVYTLNWSLSGNEAATGVVITDALPANVAFVSCTGGCTQAGGIVTWNLGAQNVGASGSVAVTVNVATPLPNGTVLTNNARIADSNGGVPTTASAQTTVSSSHLLSITKTGPTSVSAGGQITYTLRYTVTGNETAQNVTIDDNTPVNTTFASATGSGTIQTPPIGSTGLVRWQLGNLTPGTSGVATLIVNVNSPLPNGTVIANTATIADTNGGTTVNSSWNTTVGTGHSFTLSKSDTPDPVSPNGIINYTINWTVSGNEVAQNVVITDAIPANTTLVSPGTCSQVGSIVQCTLGNQNPGALGAVSLQVRVNTPLANGTVINNAARISDSNNGTPVVASTTTTVQSDHQFTLSKSAASVIQAGQLLTYTINWSVTGDEPASGVTITDAVPANTTYVAASCTGGCSVAGGVVTWALGARVPGNSGTVQFTVQVVSPLPNGTVINNTARIFDATRSATASASTTVGSGHGYSLSKSDAPDPVQAGGTLVYTLNWSLSGNEAATGVVITDALPANVAFVSCTGGCTQAGGIVTWNLGAQNVGASGSVAVTVNVANPLPNGTVLTNNARIADSNGGVPTTASAQTTVNSSHALHVTKTGPATVAAGGQIIYTIAWSVTGNETAQNVTIDDNTPLNTTFASATGPGLQVPPVGSTGLVRWQLGNLAPGSAGNVTLVVNVNSPLPNGTIIANTATIADTNGGTTVNSSWNTTVGTSHSFTLSKSDTPDPVSPNGIINYTINWAVSGNEVAQNVVITDAIPANTTLVSPGTCSQVGSIVQCTLGNQNPGALGAVSLQVRVNTPLANGTVINNVARISDSNNGTPVVASTTTTVQSDHQFTLSKSAASVIQAGQLLTYTINWSVTGDEPASGVTITDAVPANTTYMSCTGGCSVAGGVVTWALGARVPGNSGTVQFTVQVVSPLPNGTVINNTARIFDATRSATASASTTVGSGHGYSLSKSDAPDPVQAGGTLVYTLNWSLSGNEAATGVVITDALPANVAFVSCTGGCTQAGGIVTWNLGAQNVGASGSVAVTVNVANPLPNGTVLTNNARIADSNGGVPTTASAQTTVNSSHALHVTKTGPATVAAGGQIIYTIAWSVTGNETATGVTIDDNTPVNTTFASATGSGTIQAPPIGSTGLVRWQLGNLAPGSTGNVTLVVNVNSPLPNGTVIANTAAIADANGGATASSSWNTTVTSSHTFTLSKSDTPDPVSPNGIIYYTIHWTVSGNETAQSVVITDAIPANTAFESCGACVVYPGYVGWSLGNLTPGMSGDVSLQVRVNTPLANGAVINNAARISDSNSGTPLVASTSTTVNSTHQLSINKSAPSIVQAGQNITYTIAWSVTGDEPANSVTITDALPANTTYVAGSCTGGCSVAGGVLTWNLGNRVPGNSGSVTFIVTAGSLLPNGTVINNTAYIFDASGHNTPSSASTTVSSGHGFSLTKRDTGYDPVQAGGTIVYSIDWSVAGTEAAQGVIITDALPANTTYTSCGPATCSATGNIVTWNLGTRNPNASGTVTVAVSVASPLPNGTVLTNNARISDSNGGIATTASADTTVQSSHSLGIVKTAPASVAAGGQITYTIAWSVTGNETAVNVTLDDSTPTNTTFASASGAGTISAPPVGSSGSVRWSLGNRAPGASGTVTLVVNVNSPLPNGTVINNSASISDGNGGTTGTSSAGTVVTSSHAFALSKVDTPDPVTPKGNIYYTIFWSVTGNETAQNVIITDTIPANTTLVSAGMCAVLGPYVQCNLGNQNPGANGAVSLQVQVNSPLVNGTIITNTARISDGNGGVAVSATTTTTVVSDHNLAITKNAPTVVQVGNLIAYSIDYATSGSEVAPGVTITDAIPANTTYEPGTCQPSANCSIVGNVITWNLGDLQPNSLGIVHFSARTDSALSNGALISNTAYIFDGTGKSATSSVTTRVGGGANLVLTADRATVRPGDLITFTATFSGVDSLSGDFVQIDLPANTTFVNASGGYGNLSTGVYWVLVGPTFEGQRYLVVQALPVLDNGTVVSTTAFISGNGQNAYASGGAVVVSAPSWSTAAKLSDRASVAPTALLTYTIDLNNTGDMNAHTATLTDSLPAQITYVAGSVSASSGSASYDAVNNRINWNGSVLVGGPVVITYVVTVNPDAVVGTTINNMAYVSDEINSPTALSNEVTIIQQEARRYKVYLPIVLRASSVQQLPDLTITNITVIPSTMPVGQTGWDLQITVKNVGNAPLPNGAWMDLYIDPIASRLPIHVNMPFYDLCTYGGVWWIPQLNPGASVVLTKQDILPDWLPFFPTSFSTPGDHTLYAQIDSYDELHTPPDAWGRVYESNENNNVYGPVVVHVTGLAQNSIDAVQALPALPTRQEPH